MSKMMSWHQIFKPIPRLLFHLNHRLNCISGSCMDACVQSSEKHIIESNISKHCIVVIPVQNLTFIYPSVKPCITLLPSVNDLNP